MVHCIDISCKPLACSYSIPLACRADPECCATRTPLAVMAKLDLYSWKNTHSPTPWQGDMSHTKKLRSGLTGSRLSTQSRHNEFHQDNGFLLNGDHKDSAEKSRCNLFISMNLNNGSSTDSVPHTAPAQCSIPPLQRDGRAVLGCAHVWCCLNKA